MAQADNTASKCKKHYSYPIASAFTKVMMEIYNEAVEAFKMCNNYYYDTKKMQQIVQSKYSEVLANSDVRMFAYKLSISIYDTSLGMMHQISKTIISMLRPKITRDGSIVFP
ncbi:hypothetical protein [Candidatus Lariskella endosymbiont of Hedychridium roseum]|uniref:hypothetical protein n=1 Tax=Candidatus Lariskella endosymbiont of Hedychridium roseum TaxID=3077949 RepID=UPI0030D47C98